MINTYQLNDTDYIDLYPILSPTEIQEVFGTRSKSDRSITRFYNRIGLPSSREALNSFIEDCYAIADLDVNQDEWLDYLLEQIAQERKNKIDKIWEKIRRIEDIFIDYDY